MENLKTSPEAYRSKDKTTRQLGDRSFDLYPIDEANAESLDEMDFSDIYSQGEFEQQEKYVADTRRRLHELKTNPVETHDEKISQDLEELFAQGVLRGRWLGVHPDFDVDAIQSAEYDDYKHRVDTVVTMKLKDEDDIESIGENELVFGVDVTTSGDERVIRDKFDRPHNDKTLEVPDGFTSIGRYSDRRTHRRLSLVPRYVIGLSSTEVEDILDTTPRNGRGEPIFKYNTPRSKLIRFKILSEIHAQNVIYINSLEDKIGQGDETVDRAYNMLDIIDRTLNQALNETTLDITQTDLFAGKKLENPNSFRERREKVNEIVRERGKQDERDRKGQILARGRLVNPKHHDTYAQIMDIAAEKAANL